MATAIGLYGLDSKSNVKNPYVMTVIDEITKYNSFANSSSMIKNKKAMLNHLDAAMIAASQYMCLRPKKTTLLNQSRWQAMESIAKNIPKIIKKELDAGTLSGKFKVDPVTKKMDEENYWLERIDPKHRPGFLLSKYYGKWQTEGTAGVTFFNWLDGYLKERGEDAEGVLGMQLLFQDVDDSIKKDAEATMRDVSFGQKQVAMNAPTQRDAYKLRIGSDGGLQDAHGTFCTKHYQTHFSGKGWAVFVVEPGNTIYAGSHVVGEFHHSTFLAGETVVAAGELIADDFGKLLVITGKSGHYRPTPIMIWRFVDYARRAGILHTNAVVKPEFTGSWFNAVDFATKKHGASPMNGASASVAIPKWARNSPKVHDIVNDANAWPTAIARF